MKKFLSIAILLILNSCYYGGFCRVAPTTQESAQMMYNAFDTKIAKNITPEQAYKMFGGCYTRGDYVYVYPTFWNKKYVLVHRGEVITYAEEESLRD